MKKKVRKKKQKVVKEEERCRCSIVKRSQVKEQGRRLLEKIERMEYNDFVGDVSERH